MVKPAVMLGVMTMFMFLAPATAADRYANGTPDVMTVNIQWIWKWTMIASALITARKRSLEQGNVFTPVCSLTGGGVGYKGGNFVLSMGGGWGSLPTERGGSAYRGGSAQPPDPEPEKQAVHMLLECFLVYSLHSLHHDKDYEWTWVNLRDTLPSQHSLRFLKYTSHFQCKNYCVAVQPNRHVLKNTKSVNRKDESH